MSEHELKITSDYGELGLMLVCNAEAGAPCRTRPADKSVAEWDENYVGEMVDGGCWAAEWQSAVGFTEGVRATTLSVFGSVPVEIEYAEGVLVRPAKRAGLDTPEETEK